MAWRSQFEAAAENVTELIVAGPAQYLEKIKGFLAAYEQVNQHQIGPDQGGFVRLCEKEILRRRRLNKGPAAGPPSEPNGRRGRHTC